MYMDRRNDLLKRSCMILLYQQQDKENKLK